MDFYDILTEREPGKAYHPYAGRYEGEWMEGYVHIDFLNEHFSDYETAEEMKNATDSRGLNKYFDWIAEKGKIPAE